MRAAFQRAADTFDVFLSVWRHPPADARGFAVKLGLVDVAGGRGFFVVGPDIIPTAPIEWFWCGDLAGDGERFTARVGNEPESLRNVRYGQIVAFARDDVADWMYWRNGRIVGAATVGAVTAGAPVERRTVKYSLDCE